MCLLTMLHTYLNDEVRTYCIELSNIFHSSVQTAQWVLVIRKTFVTPKMLNNT